MAKTLTTTRTEAQLKEKLLASLELEGKDLTDFATSVANLVATNQGKNTLTPEGVLSMLTTIVILQACPEIITDVPDEATRQFRATHLEQVMESSLTPERAHQIVMWKELFTTLIWILTEDEEFTNLFEDISGIPYIGNEEDVLP